MTRITMQKVRERAVVYLRRDIVLEAADDLVPLSGVRWEVTDRFGLEEESARSMCFDVVKALLDAEVIAIGDRTDGGHFAEWQRDDNTAAHLRNAISSDSAQEAAWLCLTDHGKAWVRDYEQVLDRLTHQRRRPPTSPPEV